jgi:hypothetical protein
VKVQWDPERTSRLGKLAYRSIQIGVPGVLVSEWTRAIVSIEDVTEKARELKRVLDADPGIPDEELKRKGLLRIESEFAISENLRNALKMS